MSCEDRGRFVVEQENGNVTGTGFLFVRCWMGKK